MLTADDPYTCIDLDVKGEGDLDKHGNPLPPEEWTPPEMIERFYQWEEMFDSYTEVSTGGKGIHIWVKAHVQDSIKTKFGEVYSAARFMICTGNVLRDRPIVERNYLANEFANQYRAQKAPSSPLVELDAVEGDAELFAKIAKDDKSGKFVHLCNGNWQQLGYPSQSEADLALLGMMVHYTQSNEQCRRMFRQTALGQREKATKNDVYLNRSLVQVRATQQFRRSAIEHGREQANNLAWSYVHKVQKSPLAAAVIRQNNARHFSLLSDYDLDHLPLPRWIVKGLIPDSGIGLVYGPSGSYKSFLTLDLMAHISNGMEWFGHRVTACPAVYVPFEGRGGIPKRVKAWRLAMSRNRETQLPSNVRYIREPMNLRLQEDRDRLVLTLQENGWAGGILCIDTLAQAAGDFEENSSKDMGEMLAVFNELQARLGGVVLVVHHSGKDQSKGARGHSSLIAAVDFSIACSSDSGKYNGSFVAEKVKDDEAGVKYSFSMLRVHLGYDADGDEITSLTVCPTQSVAKDEAKSYDANLEAEDDDFILDWVAKEEALESYPSKNSLKHQLGEMKEKRKITQARVTGAIERLLADARLFIAKDKSPSGNVWLTTKGRGSLE